MWDLVKKYRDLIIGFIVGLALSIMSHCDNEIVRWVHSDILITLLCIGLIRLIRQSIDRERKIKQRERTVIDGMVDSLPVIKAINFAQEPTKEGEKIKEFITIIGGKEKHMKKLKELFDRYKGYLLTVLLGLLTAVEQFGGYINALCGGVFVINGVEVVPVVTLASTVVVGILSNGYTKEQVEKIKALFSRSSTDELVKAEIKKSLKEDTVKYAQLTKSQASKETELENLKSELESLNNAYSAKRKMYDMIPQLATAEDVRVAENAVHMCEQKIVNKESEIVEVKNTLEALKTTINALKSQL